MSHESKSVHDVINDQAQKIGFGEWEVKLLIYDGRVVGFDQVKSPTIKFRESKGRKND